MLDLQITADHIQLLLQCNLAAPNLKAASHHLAEEADNSGNFLLVLHMGFHTNRLQRIEQKMGVDLARKHLEADIVLLLLQQAILLIGYLHLKHQIMDAAHHGIELPREQRNLILAVDLQSCVKIPGSHPVDMLAKMQQTPGEERRKAENQQESQYYADCDDRKRQPDDPVGFFDNAIYGKD
ncbi:hypothetical protein D3C81_1522490 [compost metagenome]